MNELRTLTRATWAGMKKGIRWPPSWLDALWVLGFLVSLALALYHWLPYYTPIIKGGTMRGLPTPWIFRIVEGGFFFLLTLVCWAAYFAGDTLAAMMEIEPWPDRQG